MKIWKIGCTTKYGKDTILIKQEKEPTQKELNLIDMDGQVVIGEGEMDEAPMLFIGEKVGTKKGQKLDIALDPLEGTNFVANNKPNAFSMLQIHTWKKLL